MSEIQHPARALERPEIRPTSLLQQSWAIARRNLIHIKRMPEMLMDVTVQPVMFVLMFAYVFGGAIQVAYAPNGYKEYLLGGIMGQTVAFASFIVALGLTSDLDKGIVDRMRSLPIRLSAVLVGRSLSSMIHSSIGIVVMSLTGLLVGWRIRTSIGEALLGYALLLLWAFAMIWLGILVGSKMRSVEAVNGVMFTTMFPITFISSAFTTTEAMPHWLRVIAEWNPISSLIQAVRQLWGNVDVSQLPADRQWPLHHPVLATVLWCLALTAVLAPLALKSFKARTSS